MAEFWIEFWITVMMVACVLAMGCSDRFWGPNFVKFRLVVLHITGPIAGLALIMAYFYMFIGSK